MRKIELCLHFRFICFSCSTFYYTFEGMKFWKLCGNWIDRLVLVASIQNVLVLVLWCRKCLFVVVLVSFTTLRIIFFMSNLNIQIWTNTNYNISTTNKNLCCVSQYLVWIIDWIIFSHNKFSHLRFEIDDRDVEWYREIYMNKS